MADAQEPNMWPHGPVYPLAILATVLYGLAFLVMTFLVVRHRAWYFSCVAVGAAIEVAGYALRSYSIKNPTSLVSCHPVLGAPLPPCPQQMTPQIHDITQRLTGLTV